MGSGADVASEATAGIERLGLSLLHSPTRDQAEEDGKVHSCK